MYTIPNSCHTEQLLNRPRACLDPEINSKAALIRHIEYDRVEYYLVGINTRNNYVMSCPEFTFFRFNGFVDINILALNIKHRILRLIFQSERDELRIIPPNHRKKARDAVPSS